MLKRYPTALFIVFALFACGPGGSDGPNAPVCGNGILEEGEECDDGNTSAGDGCSPTCKEQATAVCGNGEIEVGEECDDGNTSAGDGCSPACTLEMGPICGNNLIENGESCDDGNTTPGDGCDELCRLEYCGNGRVEAGEECDDNNTTPGDGCDELCRTEGCGNGRHDEGEECDGSDVPPEVSCESLGGYGGSISCTESCEFDTSTCGFCGDGSTDYPHESCDDGNTVDGDGCESDCTGTSGYCTVDGNLGTFSMGSSNSVSADTTGGWHLVDLPCGGTGGAERVYTFTTTEDSHLTVAVTAAASPHTIGVYSVTNPGQGACTSGEVVGCLQLNAGENQGFNLLAGTHYLVVDSNDATGAGIVQMHLSLSPWETVLNEGFASCTLPSGWTMNGGVWEVGSSTGSSPPSCASGSCCVGTDFGTNYPAYMDWGDHCLTTSSYSIPVNAQLSFSSWMDTEQSFDGGRIEVNTGGGWLEVPVGAVNPAYNVTVGGYFAWSGHGFSGWNTWTVDLSSYTGQTIQLRWCFRSDGSVFYPGWFIDNIRIE